MKYILIALMLGACSQSHTSPFNIWPGKLQAPEDGLIEFDGTNYYRTDSGIRKMITRDEAMNYDTIRLHP